jgi:hypothetical protein
VRNEVGPAGCLAEAVLRERKRVLEVREFLGIDQDRYWLAVIGDGDALPGVRSPADQRAETGPSLSDRQRVTHAQTVHFLHHAPGGAPDRPAGVKVWGAVQPGRAAGSTIVCWLKPAGVAVVNGVPAGGGAGPRRRGIGRPL